jgi:hypothetical protein
MRAVDENLNQILMALRETGWANQSLPVSVKKLIY